MSWNDHDHRGEYAEDGHDHYDYAERHHRHYDDESTVRGLREDLGRAEERIRQLEDDLRDALNRIHVLEDDTPQARQLQYEADVAAADAHEYETHGHNCDCEFCYYDPEEDG